MTCTHLRHLIEVCEENDLRFSSRDMVHLVCNKCQKEEVCPSLLYDQYEAKHPELEETQDSVSRESKKT